MPGLTICNTQLIILFFFTTFFYSYSQTPGNVSSNLELWFKADAGINEGSVNSWSDQSGNNFDILQGGVTEQPNRLSSSVNYNPSVIFDGNSDHLPISGLSYNGTSPLNGFASFVVFKTSYTSGNYNNNWAFLDFDRSDYFNFYLHGNGALAVSYNASGINDNTAATSLNDGFPHIGVALYDNTLVNDTRMIADGILDYSADRKASGLTIGSANTRFGFIGDGSEANTFDGGRNNIYYDGSIAEVILYNEGTLTANEITRVQSYLAVKYGITLGNTATTFTYQNSVGTAIWTGDPVFQNNVAGIGRDDISALNQQKSKSENPGALVIMDKAAAFSSDLDFLLWGNDNAPAIFTTADADPAFDQRLQREWKADLTGNPGAVTVQFVMPNSGNINHYALHVDADGVFATGSTNYLPSSIIADTITFTNIPFSDGDFFTLGQKDFAPGNVSANLELWFKADAGVNEGNVDVWSDFSGNAFDINQTDAVEQPLRSSNTINFNPSLIFDGANDHLPITNLSYNGTNALSGLVSFVVFKTSFAAAGYNTNWSFLDYDRSDYFNFYIQGNGSLALSYRAGATTDNTAATALNDDIPHLGVAVYDNSIVEDTKIFADGILDFSADRIATGIDLGTSTTRFGFIGDGSEAVTFDGGRNSLFYDGSIAEVILYNAGTLNATELLQVQSYLAVKYGITLGNTTNLVSYLNSSGTTIWNGDAVFQNDVAGIGRDDATALNQPKSLSVNTDAMVMMEKTANFSNDQDYILWGNDNAAAALALTDVVPGFESRLAREWKVGVSGTPGNVTVSVIFPNTNDVTRYALHTDADGVFATGSTGYPAASINGDTISFTNVSLTDGLFFTLSKKTDIAPGSVKNNLQLWLKANDGATCMTDGCNVAAWSDKSTNINDLSQGTPVFRPVFKNNLADNVNYNPVIDFDGVDDFFSDASGILGNATYNDLNIYSVLITDAVTNSFMFEEPCNPRRISMHLPWSDNNFYWDAGDAFGNHRLATNWSSSIDVPYLWSNLYSTTSGITLPGTSQAIRRDGFNLTTDNSASPFTGTNSSFFLGKGVGGNHFNSKIAEFVVYTGPVNSIEHAKIESYLGIKYGITLSNVAGGTAGDYLASDASTIWDASLFPIYHNEIIGIGRDDAQALLQKQSHTADDSLRVFIDLLANDNMGNAGTVSNDNSYLMIGSDRGLLQSSPSALLEMPPLILDRIEREWKVTNTNFTDDFTIEVEWNVPGPYDLSVVRLLVDDDGDFSDATILGSAEGLTFSLGSIIISGINTSHIPLNSTRFITVAIFDRSLPVELLTFDAKPVNSHVELTWSTASELNNDYFTVERSVDAQNWVDVTQVDGYLNSLVVRNYSAFDLQPYKGTSYYRLRQTDIDGSFSHSGIVAINFEDDDYSGVSVFPNPARNQITIKANEEQLQEISVLNILGQDETNRTRVLEKNVFRAILDLSGLKSGFYFIKTKYSVNKFYKE